MPEVKTKQKRAYRKTSETQQINFDAAMSLMSDKGFQGTTVREICAGAGIPAAAQISRTVVPWKPFSDIRDIAASKMICWVSVVLRYALFGFVFASGIGQPPI